MNFLPWGVAALAGLVLWRARARGKMTPQRKVIYETSMRSLKNPADLQTLAAAFEKVGLKTEADALRARAALRAVPEEVKAARRDAFRKAMSSTDPVAVNKLADAFEGVGATGAAKQLRDYAAGLKKIASA